MDECIIDEIIRIFTNVHQQEVIQSLHGPWIIITYTSYVSYGPRRFSKSLPIFFRKSSIFSLNNKGKPAHNNTNFLQLFVLVSFICPLMALVLFLDVLSTWNGLDRIFGRPKTTSTSHSHWNPTMTIVERIDSLKALSCYHVKHMQEE